MILNKEYGIPYLREGGISHSRTKNKKYYLCEDRQNLKLLRKIRSKCE